MINRNYLTKREKEVLNLLKKGKSGKFIANKLGISIKTVKVHCSRIYKIENVKSKIELIIKEYNKK